MLESGCMGTKITTKMRTFSVCGKTFKIRMVFDGAQPMTYRVKPAGGDWGGNTSWPLGKNNKLASESEVIKQNEGWFAQVFEREKEADESKRIRKWQKENLRRRR